MAFAAGGNLHAFVYAEGTMRDLGTFPGGSNSMGQGISARGQVVGNAGVGGVGHAFLYAAGTMLELNDYVRSGLPTGVHLTQAFAINDRGQIIVEGCAASCAAYRLDPFSRKQDKFQRFLARPWLQWRSCCSLVGCLASGGSGNNSRPG